MAEEVISIPFGTKTLPGLVNLPPDHGQILGALLLSHGAGGDHNHPQLEIVAHGLAAEGILVLRFTCKALNIDHRVKAFGCALDYLSAHYGDIKHVIVGGRSMGARAAAMLASKTFSQLPCQETSLKKISGLLCLAFPLNAKGLPMTPVRMTPLIKLRVPVLFVAGTDDSLCQKSDLEKATQLMFSEVEVEWRQDCGHDLESNTTSFVQVMPRLAKWCQKHTDK